MVKHFKIYSLKGSKSIDLDKAAAIENDETMIINSDHTIITTPIESPQTDDMEGTSAVKKHASPKAKIQSYAFQSESDETPTSEGSDGVTVDVSKKRHKVRSDSTRSTKYEHFFCFYLFSKCVSFQLLL